MPSIHPTASSDILFISPGNPGVTKEWFTPEYWQSQDRLIHTAAGRGTVWFLDTPVGQTVLRRYRRGGFIAKFNTFHFFTQPIEQTRAFKELALLERLQQLGLPAPKPVAGMIRRNGLFYQAWLMTQVIPNAKDLYECLQQTPLEEAVWQRIGRTIAEFHKHNVYHSDLNCHNIMIDTSFQVWVIDFDKCSIRNDQKGWKKENLERLKRSFLKEQGKHAQFQFSEDAWQALLQGYDA